MSSRSLHIRNLSSPASENPRENSDTSREEGITESADDLQAGWQGVRRSQRRLSMACQVGAIQVQMLGRQEGRKGNLRFWEFCQFGNSFRGCDGHYHRSGREPRQAGERAPTKELKLKDRSREWCRQSKETATKEAV